MKFPFISLMLCLFIPLLLWADQFEQRMDALGDLLQFGLLESKLNARISGLTDIEAYVFESPPPALLETNKSWILQPRATLFVDIQQGLRNYFFAQARVDRGFDPKDSGLQARIEEFAWRLSPWDDRRLSLQAGQFTTIVGPWPKRHLSWNNPFISAPLFYENRTLLSDQNDPATLGMPGYSTNYGGNPIIWGASYTSGIAVSGSVQKWDWSIELKNASLSSRPNYWPAWKVGFGEPTLAARLSWQPSLKWTLGLSTSHGAFLAPSSSYQLGPDRRRGDYIQRLWLFDISYAFRHWQMWMEVVYTSFDGPAMERLESSAYFLELRRKIGPRLSAALRWNQQFFSERSYYGQPQGRWGDEMIRIDAAVTWRFNAYSQIQLELGSRHSKSASQRLGLSTRYTLRF